MHELQCSRFDTTTYLQTVVKSTCCWINGKSMVWGNEGSFPSFSCLVVHFQHVVGESGTELQSFLGVLGLSIKIECQAADSKLKVSIHTLGLWVFSITSLDASSSVRAENARTCGAAVKARLLRAADTAMAGCGKILVRKSCSIKPVVALQCSNLDLNKKMATFGNNSTWHLFHSIWGVLSRATNQLLFGGGGSKLMLAIERFSLQLLLFCPRNARDWYWPPPLDLSRSKLPMLRAAHTSVRVDASSAGNPWAGCSAPGLW